MLPDMVEIPAQLVMAHEYLEIQSGLAYVFVGMSRQRLQRSMSFGQRQLPEVTHYLIVKLTGREAIPLPGADQLLNFFGLCHGITHGSRTSSGVGRLSGPLLLA